MALELFRHVVLDGRSLHAAVVRYGDSAALERRCAAGARVLVLAAEAPAHLPLLKPVAIAPRTGARAVSPTPEALHGGEYPLRLPLYLVVRRTAIASARPLVRYLAGEGAVPHFERAGLVPLPPAARAQQLAALEKL